MENSKANRIGAIIEEMQSKAEKAESQSPEWWLDRASQLAVLWTTITEDLVKYEMAWKKEVWELVEKGSTVSKAEYQIQATSDNYKTYNYLKKKDQQVIEIIKLAKKRNERNF